VWTGRVSPWLLWDRHPAGLAIVAVLALILLVWMRRLFRRRPAPPSTGATENTV
jgi:membrane protein implicated in regulation of membrane protease activity